MFGSSHEVYHISTSLSCQLTVHKVRIADKSSLISVLYQLKLTVKFTVKGGILTSDLQFLIHYQVRILFLKRESSSKQLF